MNRSTYLAILLVLLAIGAWVGVVLFSQSIQAQEADVVSTLQSQEQSSDAQSSSVRLHALAQDAAPQSAVLDTALQNDVVSIANTLQAAGTPAGVKLTISGALPEAAPSSDAGASQIQAIGFAVEGSGSFSAVMRVAQLLETLPLPSSVQQLDIQRVDNSSGVPTAAWHMNAYVHVLTSAPISS